MRLKKSFISLVLPASMLLAGSATADEFNDYGEAVLSHFLTGLNSVVTAPADPIMSIVSPLEEYLELPAGPVLGRCIGAVQGVVMAAYRAGMGTLDMVLSPIPISILSPEPRYQPIPGFEWEE